MRRFALIVLVLGLHACGDAAMDAMPASSSSLEAALVSNDSWPYEVVGILDIVEAGYDYGDDPEWAVGSLITADDEWGVLIEIDGTVIARAGINIDSGKEVRVWLDAPLTKYGETTYPVTRIERL